MSMFKLSCRHHDVNAYDFKKLRINNLHTQDGPKKRSHFLTTHIIKRLHWFNITGTLLVCQFDFHQFCKLKWRHLANENHFVYCIVFHIFVLNVILHVIIKAPPKPRPVLFDETANRGTCTLRGNGTIVYKKLSCRRRTARCFVSLSLSHFR